MILNDVGMLAVSSNRTRAYLQNMIKRDMLPALVILMVDPDSEIKPGQNKADLVDPDNVPEGRSGGFLDLPGYAFDPEENILLTLRHFEIPFRVIKTLDVNNEEVARALEEAECEIMIYSGAGGAILRKHLFETGKKFLHCHPGYLPDFRGSTTIYYSILKEGTVGVSALFLNEKIDQGPVLARRKFPLPSSREELDYQFDPRVRSEMLLEVLLKYRDSGEFEFVEQDREKGETYYIIHPVLKHIAILSLGQ